MTPFDGSIESWIDHARRMQQLGNHASAVDALKRALSVEPTDAEAHALLALSLLAFKRLHAAAREAQEAVNFDPELSLALYAVAAVAIAERRWEDAATALDVLLSREPDEVAYLRLAADLRRRVDVDDAIALLERARQIDPDDPHTLCDLGELAMQKNERARAGELAAAALGQAPELARAHVLAGYVALSEGQVVAARDHVVAALRQHPGDEQALHLLTAIKARESLLLGVWWRFQVLLGEAGSRRSLLVLLGVFVLVQLAVIAAEAFEAPRVASVMVMLWLGFCAYTWYAPTLFRKMLEKELESVELSPEF